MKQFLTKKQRAYTIQASQGFHPSEAAKRVGIATTSVATMEKRVPPVRRWKNEELVDKLRAFWMGVIEKAPEVEWKGNDVLRASDLLAHHIGMFEPEATGNTYNTIIVADNKSSDEQTLLKKLEALRNNGLPKP